MLSGKSLNWVAVIIWGAVIYAVSDIPNLRTDLGLMDYVLRKIVHIAIYGALYALFYRAYRGSFKKNKFNSFIVSIIFCLLFAVSDEFHQSFVPGRSGSIIDALLFDGSGSLFTAWVIHSRKNA